MKVQPKPFQIRLTQVVIFCDINGSILRHYEVGTVLTATAKSSHWFVTSMGDIWFDEAEEIV